MPMTDVPVHADTNRPNIFIGTGILNEGCNTADARTVDYGGKTWYVIGYNGNGAAGSNGTITLFATGSTALGIGQSPFNTEDTGGITELKSAYSGSVLKTQVDAVAGGFSPFEQSAISGYNLTAGIYSGDAYTEYIQPEGSIAGPQVEALLWPLSTEEANRVADELLVVDPARPNTVYNCFWLRSAYDRYLIVQSDSSYTYYGTCVSDKKVRKGSVSLKNNYFVRPAFQLNMNAVLLTSASDGKESGEEGADALTKVTGRYPEKLPGWKAERNIISESAHIKR